MISSAAQRRLAVRPGQEGGCRQQHPQVEWSPSVRPGRATGALGSQCSFREALPGPWGFYPGFCGAVAHPRGHEQDAEEGARGKKEHLSPGWVRKEPRSSATLTTYAQHFTLDLGPRGQNSSLCLSLTGQGMSFPFWVPGSPFFKLDLGWGEKDIYNTLYVCNTCGVHAHYCFYSS